MSARLGLNLKCLTLTTLESCTLSLYSYIMIIVRSGRGRADLSTELLFNYVCVCLHVCIVPVCSLMDTLICQYMRAFNTHTYLGHLSLLMCLFTIQHTLNHLVSPGHPKKQARI